MKNTVQSRLSTELSESLERNLKHYALAASAAGVGLLASGQRAEAKVVYTPANVPIIYDATPVPLDLNHDGTNDFTLSAIAPGGRFYKTYIQVAPVASANRVWGMVEKGGFRSASFLAAADLPRGVEVGPKGRFANAGAEKLAEKFWYLGTASTSTGSFGPWANYGKGVMNRFLGFKFTINGETHYGWARLNVVFQSTIPYATLTGYAYETVANKPILTAGVAAAANTSTEAQPATLGHLARGGASHSGMARRDPEPLINHMPGKTSNGPARPSILLHSRTNTHAARSLTCVACCIREHSSRAHRRAGMTGQPDRDSYPS